MTKNAKQITSDYPFTITNLLINLSVFFHHLHFLTPIVRRHMQTITKYMSDLKTERKKG